MLLQLFVIEGDFIQLREGAQEIVAATSALAKVAAAAAATSSYSSQLPSVAVTPIAQSHRLKNPSMDSKYGKVDNTFLAMKSQHSNGVSFNVVGGVSTVKILSKPKDHMELNGPAMRLGNGANPDKSDLGSSQSKRPSANFSAKHQGRYRFNNFERMYSSLN